MRHTHTVALSGRNRRPVSDVLEKNSAQVITRLVLFPCDNDMNSASRNVKISSHKKLSSHKRHQTQKKSRTMQLHIISRKRCDGRSDRNKPTPSLSRSLPRTRRLAQRGIALPLRVGFFCVVSAFRKICRREEKTICDSTRSSGLFQAVAQCRDSSSGGGGFSP